ncbi:MAG: multicomponent Na+:H+ antiporter subunit [Thermoproteota archaeon]|nr:multicomponent Na+:H+ antiporter subunit [Thermoproteota archaeon]
MHLTSSFQSILRRRRWASDLIDLILTIIGEILIAVGVFCSLVASIGMLRFPNFFVRLHAATVGSMGGSFLPIIGAGLIALGSDFPDKWMFFGGLIVAAIIVMLVSPAGSHALARATHRARVAPVEPKVTDHLKEDEDEKEGEKD